MLIIDQTGEKHPEAKSVMKSSGMLPPRRIRRTRTTLTMLSSLSIQGEFINKLQNSM